MTVFGDEPAPTTGAKESVQLQELLETVFADPDELHLDRPENPHVTFGRGSHNCLAAQLARTELAVAREALLDNLPHLPAAGDRPATRDDEAPAKSPLTLHADW